MILDKQRIALYWLVLVYTSGTIGIVFAPDFFLPFTPLNLLMSAAFIFNFSMSASAHRTSLLVSLLCIAPAAWGIEWLGVHTGLIFGTYTYGASLGTSLDGIPLIIGINWWMLAFCAVQFAMHAMKLQSHLSIAAVAATVMMVLDVLMEFVAPVLDFWSFTGMEYAPLHNFVGWWLSAFVLILAFGKPLQTHRSSLALPLLVLQALFFGVLALVL